MRRFMRRVMRARMTRRAYARARVMLLWRHIARIAMYAAVMRYGVRYGVLCACVL